MTACIVAAVILAVLGLLLGICCVPGSGAAGRGPAGCAMVAVVVIGGVLVYLVVRGG